MLKKLLLVVLGLTMAGVVVADIHEPPAQRYDAKRKLARGLANITMGWTEIPYQTAINYHRDGSIAAVWSGGVVDGLYHTGGRLFLGIYEVATFPLPTTKGDFRPPYPSETLYRYKGWEEFPPQFGTPSETIYCRDYRGVSP